MTDPMNEHCPPTLNLDGYTPLPAGKIAAIVTLLEMTQPAPPLAERAGHGLTLESPRDGAKRGSQVSFEHENAYAIMQALIERGVIGDFRAPATLRFGLTPLYVSFMDVWRAVEILEDILSTDAWKDPRFSVKAAVT